MKPRPAGSRFLIGDGDGQELAKSVLFYFQYYNTSGPSSSINLIGELGPLVF